MRSWKEKIEAIPSAVDFLDDKVRNKTISVLILISVMAPVLHWMLFFFDLDGSFYNNPLFLYAMYSIVATVGSLILISLGLGNQLPLPKSKYSHSSNANLYSASFIIISIISCLGIALYCYSLAHQYSHGDLTFGKNWIYLMTSLLSCMAAFLAVLLYLYLLFVVIFKSSNNYDSNDSTTFYYNYKQHLLKQAYEYLPKFQEILLTQVSNSTSKNINVNNSNDDTNKNNNNNNINNENHNHNYNCLNCYLNNIEMQERELEKGWKYLLKQFLWPTLDFDIIFDKNNTNDNSTTDKQLIISKISHVTYPSRLYICVFLGLLFVFAGTYLNIYCYVRLSLVSKTLNMGYQQLNQLSDATPIEDNDDLSEATNTALSHLNNFEKFVSSLQLGLGIGIVLGTLLGVYSCMITFVAWKKKIVFMRLGIPTFRLNNNNKQLFQVWWTTRLMGTIASYFGTGAFLFSWIIGITIGIITWSRFWQVIVVNYWQYICGYLLYYVVDYIIRYFVFSKYISDSKNFYSLQKDKVNIFSNIIILNDFLFIPLAMYSGLINMYWYMLIALFKFMRPDINIYPRGMESWDYAYLTYIASIRITVERENRLIDQQTIANNLINVESTQQHKCSLAEPLLTTSV